MSGVESYVHAFMVWWRTYVQGDGVTPKVTDLVSNM